MFSGFRSRKYMKQRTKNNKHDLEQLERRQLMATNTVVSLPFRLDFNTSVSDSILDKDGQGTGLTRVQTNKLGNEYQAGLIDLVTGNGQLKITSTGTSSAGSSSGSDNTQVDALETQFDGTTSGFAITARLVGPLSNLSSSYQSAGIYFGPDQDNFLKFVAINMGSGTSGQFLQFKDEINGISSLSDTANRISIGNFSSVSTLDLRLVGDALNGKVSAFYSVNGGAFQQLAFNYTIPTSKLSAFFNGTARAGLLVSQKNNLTPITAVYDSFEITAGADLGDRPTITATRPANGEINVNRDSFIAADINLPNSGGGVDTATINSTNVKLYRTSDGVVVTGVINTTGGGDAIVFTPSSPLAANTSYTFEITSGVRDTTGAAFVPYSSTFTTGTAGGTVNSSINFSKTPQAVTQGTRYTSLVFGPDKKLYATTIDGKVMRWTVAADGTLSSPQTILTVQNVNGGRRSAIGIVFDPASTASNLIAYVSNSDFAGLELKEYESEALGAASNWTGRITKLTGANLETGVNIVTGLPRSVRDHQNYQMAFGPDGKLYISQSSMSAMGAPDNAWGNKAETLLSASILQVNTAAIGNSTVNVQTEGVASPYDPFATNALVKIYATGLRSAYDILFHSNGTMYSATNGSAAGGNTPAGGGVQGLTNVPTQDDYLFKVTNGKYYGHPNPLRGEYVLNGGNPTTSNDPMEVAKYSTGTMPDSDWGGYVYDFGKNLSPNGMIEYKGNAFGGALDGKIMIVRYSGGDDIMILSPNANGTIASAETGFMGLSGFVNPLDLVQDPTTGNVYVIEFGDQAQVPGTDARITLLKAVDASAPGTAITSISRNKVYFSDQTSTSGSSLAQNVRISNTGTAPLTINSLVLSGTNASEFSFKDANGNTITTPITIQPGSWQDVYIYFKATTTGIRTGTLTITTSTGTETVSLRALGLSGTGGSLEPSLQRILDLYQIGVNVGDNDPGTTDFPTDTATSADEVTMPRLIKAGSGPVTVEVLGVFANQTAASFFGWYESGNPQSKNPVLSVATSGGQSIAPLQDGMYSFDPGTGNFGIYGNFTLGTNNPINRDVYSENSLNTWETVTSRQKKVRYYKYRDSSGAVVPNAYIVTFEEYNLSFDQNDMVAIIRNVQAAPDAPELGIENRDGTPFANHLSMSRITNKDVNNPNEFHDTSTLRIRNTGSQVLNISSMSISSSDFQIISGGGAQTIQPNGYIDVLVKFVYTSTALGNTIRNATLTINSNDPDEAAKQVSLSGLWQSYSENQPNGVSAEPVGQKIIDVFGYKVNIGNLNTGGFATKAGEETLSELWQRADSGLPVGIVQLAAYHQMYNIDFSTKSTINWYNPNNISGTTGKPIPTKVFTHTSVDGQSILPRLDGSTTQIASGTFMPTGVTSFGFKVDGVWSTDVLNTPNDKNNPGHGIRFYQAKDKNGKIIPNTYILMQDYVGVSYANYDYQDNIYLLTNVKPASAPTAPATPTATVQNAGISLNWSDSTEGNVTGYNVYRASSAAGPYVKINNNPVSTSDYLDTMAPVGSTSYYVVTAVTYQNQESAQSNYVSATRTTGGPAVPTAPSGLVASATSQTSISLTWVDNSSNETGFRIERKTGSGTYSVLTSLAAGATTYTDNTASAGTTYTYRVIATSANGDSSPSNESTTTTVSANPLDIKSINIGNPTPGGSVNVITPQKDFDVTVGGVDIWGTYDSFNFQYQQRTGNFDVAVQVTDLTAIDSSTMAGIMMRESLTTGSRNAYIKVRPGTYRFNYRGTTNGSTVGTGSGTSTFPNAYVRLQRVGNTFNSFTSNDGISWTAFASVTMDVGTTVYVGLATASHSSTTATTAKYRNYGDTGSTPTTAPNAPTNLVTSAQSSTSVKLNWTDNASNETGYRVERKTGSGAWQSIATLAANTNTYTDATASAGLTYTYRIFATASADSNPSNESTITTPGTTTGVTITTSADTYVNDGTNAAVNYGSASGLQVKKGGTGYNRITYLKFNISSLTSVSDVKLRLYANLNTADSVNIGVYDVSNTSWSESTMTYNNKPAANTTAIATGTVSSTTASWVEINITAYIQAAIAAGKTTISLALQAPVNTTAYVNVASKESGNGAQLLAS